MLTIRTISHFGLGRCACLLLELLGERLIIEESPRIIELVIPCPLEVMHTLKQIIELLITYQTQKSSVDARAIRVIWCVVVSVDSSQGLWRLARC